LPPSINAQPANVSVTAPIGLAIERVKLVLFRPFDLGRWLTIGLGAWLAGLGRGGGGFNFNYSPGSHQGHVASGSAPPDFRAMYDRAHTFVMNNLMWIIPLAIVIVLFLLALGILMAWLRAHGNFMFLHCVALNKAETSVPWNKLGKQSNSLFLFNLLLGFIGMLLALPMIVLMVLAGIRILNHGQPIMRVLLTLVPLVLMFLAVALVFLVIHKLTVDFVVPIMFVRGSKCRAAWSELINLVTAHVGRFVLYLLFQIVLALATFVLVVMVIFCTCCVAGCLMIIPYIGTVLLLPVLVFKRSYSLYYLAQYGPAYDAFPPPESPPPPLSGSPPQ